MTNDDKRQFWTRREVAEHLRLTERTVDALRKAGKLPCVRVANNSVRFTRDNVMALIQDRRA
jgi:excisionase family DNA binding protein